jgi:hypothetical protein
MRSAASASWSTEFEAEAHPPDISASDSHTRRRLIRPILTHNGLRQQSVTASLPLIAIAAGAQPVVFRFSAVI